MRLHSNPFKAVCVALLLVLGQSVALARESAFELRIYSRAEAVPHRSRAVFFHRIQTGVEDLQIFETCSMRMEVYRARGPGAYPVDCQAIGRNEGYLRSEINAFVDRLMGKAMGPDWQSVRINIFNAGVSGVGALVFFILDPTKYSAASFAAIATMNGGSAWSSLRQENVLDPATSEILRMDGASSGQRVLVLETEHSDRERLLRVALARLDRDARIARMRAQGPPRPVTH